MKDYSEETGDGNRGGTTCTAGRRCTGIPCSTWTSIVFTFCMPTLVSIRPSGDFDNVSLIAVGLIVFSGTCRPQARQIDFSH